MSAGSKRGGPRPVAGEKATDGSEHEQLLRIFVQEAADRLDLLDGLVLEIEQEPAATLIAEFMRGAHTLKGSAGIAGLPSMSELAHAVESLIVHLRDGRVRPSPELFDRLSRALDELRQSLAAVSKGEAEPAALLAVRAQIEQFMEAQGAAGVLPAAPAEQGLFALGEYDRLRLRLLREQGKGLYRVGLAVPAEAGDPVAWSGAVLKVLRKVGVVVATSPSAAQIDSLPQVGELHVLLAAASTLDDVTRAIGEARLAASVAVEEHAGREQAPPAAIALPLLAAERTVRVELPILDDLLRLVGELMLDRDRIREAGIEIAETLADRPLAGEIQDSAIRVGRIASQLQEAVVQARLVPVARLFRAAKRGVRQAARDLDRPIGIAIAGEATQLDKKVLDVLGEPLAAMAQGLARVAWSRAQPETQQLVVAAHRRWNQVVLEITAPCSEPPAAELARLHAAARGAGGRVERQSDDERTTIAAVLPLSLAIVRVVLAEVGGEVYAFPVEAVHEAARLTRAALGTVGGTPFTHLQGRALPLLPLRAALEIPGEDPEELQLLAVGRRERPVGVVVDRLLGIREVVIKPLGPRLSNGPLSGAAILNDQQIAWIVNVGALIETEAAPRRTAIRQPREEVAV